MPSVPQKTAESTPVVIEEPSANETIVEGFPYANVCATPTPSEVTTYVESPEIETAAPESIIIEVPAAVFQAVGPFGISK